MKYLILLLLLIGCSNPKYNCDYIIITKTNAIKDGEIISTQNPVSYGFYIDTALIKIKSFDDAARGVVTMVSDGSDLKSDITGVWDQERGESVIENISKEYLTIVVCDPSTRCWAYRLGKTDKGLNEVIVPLIFEPWMITPENPTYNSGSWRIGKDEWYIN